MKLVYKSGEVVRFIPGTREVYTVKKYKEDSGFTYSRKTLYLQKYDDDADDSDDDYDDDADLPEVFERYIDRYIL